MKSIGDRVINDLIKRDLFICILRAIAKIHGSLTAAPLDALRLLLDQRGWVDVDIDGDVEF